MMTLYHSPLLPACRKVRLMLREKSIEHRLVNEDFWTRRVELFAMNPSGELPILVTDRNQVICGSYAICEYLDEQFPNILFFGNTPTERAEVRRLVEWFDVKFDREVSQFVLFEKVFKRAMGYGEPTSDAIRAGKRNIAYHLDYISYLLGHRNWLAGEYLTLADIAAAAQLSCLDYLGDVPWDEYPAVKEWYALIKCRPAFRELLEDRAQGFKPHAHYADHDF